MQWYGVSVPAFPVNISYLSVVPMLKHYQDNIDYRVTRTVRRQQQISISKIFAYTTQIINHRCICQQSYFMVSLTLRLIYCLPMCRKIMMMPLLYLFSYFIYAKLKTKNKGQSASVLITLLITYRHTPGHCLGNISVLK